MTPTGSKGSNGRVEQANRAVEGMTRTIMSCLETRYDVETPTGHPVEQWAIRHAAWLWERFQTGEDGLNGYYRQYQRSYQSAILPSAEIVLSRDPGPHMLKLRSKWGYGVWLGMSVASDSHVIGTRVGCFLVRGVRRMPPSARHQGQVLLSMRGTPARLAHGGPADEPRVLWKNHRHQWNQEGAAHKTWRPGHRQESPKPCPKGEKHQTQPTPNEPMSRATPSSSAIVSSGGEHAKRPADPTVEEEIPMSEIKRPRGPPITRVLPLPGTMEYTEECPGCKGD